MAIFYGYYVKLPEGKLASFLFAHQTLAILLCVVCVALKARIDLRRNHTIKLVITDLFGLFCGFS